MLFRSARETAGFLTLCLLLRRRVAGGGTPALVRLVDRGSFVCPGVGIETVAMAAASWNNFSPSFPRSGDVVGEAVELVLCLGLIGVALVPAKLWAFVPGFLPRLAGFGSVAGDEILGGVLCGWLSWSGLRGWWALALVSSPVLAGGGQVWAAVARRDSSADVRSSSRSIPAAVPDGYCGIQRSLAAIELRQPLGSRCSGLLLLQCSCGSSGAWRWRKFGLLFLQDVCPCRWFQHMRSEERRVGKECLL